MELAVSFLPFMQTLEERRKRRAAFSFLTPHHWARGHSKRHIFIVASQPRYGLGRRKNGRASEDVYKRSSSPWKCRWKRHPMQISYAHQVARGSSPPCTLAPCKFGDCLQSHTAFSV